MKRVKLGGTKYPGLHALVDDGDFERVPALKWHPKNGYPTRNLPTKNGKRGTQTMHQFLFGSGLDHINRNRLDTRRANFREATCLQNSWNATTRRDNSSGMKGVNRDAPVGRRVIYFVARIQVNKKRICLGYFKTLQAAKIAYQVASRKYHKEFSIVG